MTTQTEQTSTKSTVSPVRRFLPPLIAAALVVALGVGLFRGNGQVSGPLVGKPAPSFALQTLDGGTVSLASLKGRPVVLNFWASWCVPCRDEAPILRDLSEKQTAGGLAVVGVVFSDKDLNGIKSFIQQYGLAYPSLLDPKLDTAISYGVSGVPETFFIDKNGMVRGYDQGGLTADRLNAGLNSIGVTF
ncbi:TlpA family protein disulfide reductase [Deinococcus ruber]|uniref:Thiol:disulfide interchange protein n=1 Tax=Deinococcus ruber TaxID=1848197 RepID=A0A918CLV5_9DEIO|nr:TlpA disulfide reductase family protein [Deinococcus ruber]GGR29886.1 thiol:disulfide interchange protein [Deinococcus ruber]